jgi:hypothetical protein
MAGVVARAWCEPMWREPSPTDRPTPCLRSSIMFQRTGTGCLGTTMPAAWLAIAVVAQLYIVAMLVRMSVVLLRAWRRGLLERNFCTFAALGAGATELALATYNFANVWQCAGGTSKLPDGVLFVGGKTAMFVLLSTLVVTWRLMVFSVAEQSFAVKELADGRRQLRLACLSFSVLVLGIPAFELTGRSSWAAALSLLFTGVGTYNVLSAVRELTALFDASVNSDAEQRASVAGLQAPEQRASAAGQQAPEQRASAAGQQAPGQRASAAGQLAPEQRASAAGLLAPEQRASAAGQQAPEQRASAAGQQGPVDGSKPARAPPRDLQRFLSRLVLCRRDLVLGMTLAALSMGYYLVMSEEHSSAALTPSFFSFANFHATKVIVAWSVWGFSRVVFGPLQDKLATPTRAAARAAGRAKVRPSLDK